MTTEQETAELEAIGDFHDQALAEIKRLTEENNNLKDTLRIVYKKVGPLSRGLIKAIGGNRGIKFDARASK